MSAHLGAELAALIDGELGHAARERVLRHLTRCAPCRTEVDDQRRLKTRLLGLGETAPGPAPDLAARLRALPGADGGLLPDGPAQPEGRVRSASGHLRPGWTAALRRRTPRSRRLPHRAVGGALLALGLGAVLVLGAPQRAPNRTPVDPASDAFLVEHAGTTGGLPLPGPAGVTSAGLGP